MQWQLRHPHLQRQTQGLNLVLSQSSHISGVAGGAVVNTVPVQPSTSTEGDTGIEPGFSQSSHTSGQAAGVVLNTVPGQASISTAASTVMALGFHTSDLAMATMPVQASISTAASTGMDPFCPSQVMPLVQQLVLW